ncbi:hypothetical protein [Rhizobium mesoamericanum]|uniref:Uncharacterized protein n=1 Tax=Rhizobium mesoamericanum STM3625 TaxID=1211777 RepID=K0Q013_9HYPH|nr:hypothetical protein [Rhizobium mesoamericanum]CCM77147.1 conserved hypothetical protein [Rhizobium mesoamericanum STM3625]
MGTTQWPKAPLFEEDMDALASILRTWCGKHQHDFNGEESRVKARELVEWFEFGVKDPIELADLIEGKHWQVERI